MDLFDHGSARSAIAYRKYFTNDRILSGFWAGNYDAVVIIAASAPPANDHMATAIPTT